MLEISRDKMYKGK